MLLQDDAHQLTARADASLREELLKCGFDRALGDSDSVRNLLIGKTLEYTGEHPLFSFSEPPTSIFLCSSLVSEGGLQLLLIQPYLAGHHITDSLRQQCGRVTFQENPGNPGADQFRCHPSIQTCCHNQNLSREPLRPGQFHELPAIVLAEIEVEEYHINQFLPQNLQRLLNRPAMRSNVESRLRGEQPTYTFPEQGVVV